MCKFIIIPSVTLNPGKHRTRVPSIAFQQKTRSSHHLMMWNSLLASVGCVFTHGRLVAPCAAGTPRSEVSSQNARDSS